MSKDFWRIAVRSIRGYIPHALLKIDLAADALNDRGKPGKGVERPELGRPLLYRHGAACFGNVMRQIDYTGVFVVHTASPFA